MSSSSSSSNSAAKSAFSKVSSAKDSKDVVVQPVRRTLSGLIQMGAQSSLASSAGPTAQKPAMASAPSGIGTLLQFGKPLQKPSSSSSPQKDDGGKSMVDDTSDLLADCDLESIEPEALLKLITKDPEGAIRAILLGRMGREDRFLFSTKRNYVVQSFFLPATTEFALAPCHIGGGTGPNQRQTDTVRLRHLSIKLRITRIPTGNVDQTGTNVPYFPIMSMIVFRDKVPYTVGSCPQVWGNDDLNPPADIRNVMSTLDYSSTGITTTSSSITAVAVQNPMTAPQYHIYALKHETLNSGMQLVQSTPAPAGGVNPTIYNQGQVLGKSWHKTYSIPLNGVKQQYHDATSNLPTLNDIWIVFKTDIPYSTSMWYDQVVMTTEATFDDVPYE